MSPVHDDLDHPVDLPARVGRVVSLVPSLTEALATVSPESIVGATDWCTHPADLATTRVRGTKNPSLDAIRDLSPEVVVANKEENRELDVRRLRESGVQVWVTDIRTVPQAIESMGRLFDALGWAPPSWLAEARELWSTPQPPRRRTVAAIWRDPWMWVGANTFTGDLLERVGLPNAIDQPRYPTLPVEHVDGLGADLALLPDEPYVFTADDGPEAFTHTPTALVQGRLLTWYGPSLVEAHAILAQL